MRAISILVSATVLSVVVAFSVPPASAASPQIRSLFPERARPGFTIHVSGTNLAGATRVRVAGVRAAFRVATASSLWITVPSGAGTGPVTVETRDGVATSRRPLQVDPIEHVVVIFQENHSFDETLGMLCQDFADGTIVRPGSATGATAPPRRS